MNELLPIIRRQRRPLVPVQTRNEIRVVSAEAEPANANERGEDKKPNPDDSISEKAAPAADVVGD